MIGIDIIAPHVEMITPKHDPDWAKRALLLVEECGRVSHKSEGRIKEGSAEPFIKKIAINYGHESILEHAGFTACFVGSRSMSHQLVRHRLAAITQESQRFCDYSSEKKQEDADHKFLKVIMPPSIMGGCNILWGTKVTIREDSGELVIADGGLSLRKFLMDYSQTNSIDGKWMENGYVWCQNQVRDYLAYLGARDRGIPSEDARSHLTNACKTEVYVTYNWRMWRHVLGHVKCGRALNDHAQWEIKGLFLDVLTYFEKYIPLMVSGLKEHYVQHKILQAAMLDPDEWAIFESQIFRSEVPFEVAEGEARADGIMGFWKIPITVRDASA